MNSEIVSVALAAGTLVVVGAASVAAIVQLRHLRASNQLNALLEIMNQWNDQALQAALAEVRAMPTKMKDPEYLRMLESPVTADRSRYPEFLALDLWEQIGTYTKYGLVDEKLVLDITSYQVTSSWEGAEAAIELIRKHTGLSALENFEYLAVRATLWAQRYPNGTYPARLARMSDLNASREQGPATE